MADGIEQQPQGSKQTRESKLPEGVLSSPEYQAEKMGLAEKNKALKSLTLIPCSSPDAPNRDKFIQYIEGHPQSSQIFLTINTLSQQGLCDCFDESEGGVSFKQACNQEFIEDFCKKVKKEVTEAKKEVTEAKKEVIKTQQLSETEKQTLSELRDKIKNHPHISEKNKQIILNKDNDPSSQIFKDATKSILAELKVHAQSSKNPEDLREYASMVEQFHSIGAVSGAEFAVFKRELSEMAKTFQEGKDAGQLRTEFKLPEGFRADKDGDGVYTKFASAIGDRFDEVVTLDKNGRGSKDVISARSGYKVHLDDAVDLKEQDLIVRESKLHSALDNYDVTIKKTDAFIGAQEKIEKESTDPQKKEEAQENIKKAREYKEQQAQKLGEKKEELTALQKQLSEQQAEALEQRGTIQSREEEARKTIDFVDSMGLYTLGVENVDKFFSLVSTGSSSGKIDISDGLDEKEKGEIRKAFSRLLGEGGKELFDDTGSFALREGKTAKDIQNLLKSRPFYHVGEVPPVRYSELEQAMKTKVA